MGDQNEPINNKGIPPPPAKPTGSKKGSEDNGKNKSEGNSQRSAKSEKKESRSPRGKDVKTEDEESKSTMQSEIQKPTGDEQEPSTAAAAKKAQEVDKKGHLNKLHKTPNKCIFGCSDKPRKSCELCVPEKAEEIKEKTNQFKPKTAEEKAAIRDLEKSMQEINDFCEPGPSDAGKSSKQEKGKPQ